MGANPNEALSADVVSAALQIIEAHDEAETYKRTHRREFTDRDFWYDWQLEGFDNVACYQSMTMAGNQTGKTISNTYHTALDLTGDYPEWWKGFKFTHGIDAMALGVDNEQLKEVVQSALFGQVTERKQFTGGWVHPDEILAVEWAPASRNLARRVTVRSKYGRSVITLRAYTQAKTGQETLSFAGTVKDLILVDECPPDELVGQLTIRTINGNRGKGGRMRFSMTPELGVTQLVDNFMNNRKATQKLIGPIAWEECKHLTPDKQAAILANVPEHEHDMRMLGVPFFGSGLVYPIAENRIKCEPFEYSGLHWWRCIRAIDLGIDHPTAICWFLYDTEEDVIYLVKTYAVAGENAATHTAAANSLFSHAPIVFPHDMDNREKGSGKTTRHYYEKAGLKNGIDFHNPDESIHVEPGIKEVYERMRDGRFKVFSTCTEFWREIRLYHRKDGKLVKKNDDVMDATRQGVVMLPRHGAPLTSRVGRPSVRRAMP